MSKEGVFRKRDALLAIEASAQSLWGAAKTFEVDASNNPLEPKYMVAFPYPYMNGRLHLGHSFSLSKAEFAIGYERLKGKRALFPFGFHCTGMPIKACADKLKREVELFGPDFSGYNEEEQENEPVVVAEAESDDPTKIKKKHGKAVSKNTGLQYQFQILRSMNVPNEEIHKFANPVHWLYYFPPHAQSDLKRLGCKIDWRRSFITTDANPYYDSFIRWQFNQLRAKSKIQFGERYTIYSPLDGQACMDHDRASGEGVGVQEYTGIKLKVLLDVLEKSPVNDRVLVKDRHVGDVLSSPAFVKALGGRSLFLVAATLRPETMYGQTNCFVGVDLDYGVYQVNDKEAWVCTERSAKNMAWQGIFENRGQVIKLADLKGIDLVGVPLSAPFSTYDIVYTLPMEGVLATKGTGVVTSVPSDSPDDFITLQDLAKKSAYYNVQKEWVEPFLPPKPIIDTPNYGNLCAVKAVAQFKINSQKDKEQLKNAKEAVYKEGFYNGTMLVGPSAGRPVQEAKPVIRQLLIDQGLGFPYCEPEGVVISRSGDECVVTLAAQWYMNYGEESWKKLAKENLALMNTYHEETRNAFDKTLDWLSQWACSRSFGLGSRLPWDKEWLIESLSDSTIYMAYYTVAHLLQGGTLDGSGKSPLGIKAEEMTDDVWSYVLLDEPFPKTTIPKENVDLLKKEFNYFYPLDMRCSGKDLINNHLTFFIYNHVAIFPKEKWPRSIRVNGHLLLNNAKMAKSTGNFLTLDQALSLYGADAVRFGLADAGDTLDDANFLQKTADDAILKLFTEKEWMEETMASFGSLRTGEFNWADKVFSAEIDGLILQADEMYAKMLYREALKVSFYDLENARNEYRKTTTGQGLALGAHTKTETFDGMHIDLVKRYMEIHAILMSPFTPHWSEYIYRDLLKNEGMIVNAKFPTVESKPDHASLLAAATYIRSIGSKIRSGEDQAAKKAAKGKKVVSPTETGSRNLVLYVSKEFPEWQTAVLNILKQIHDPVTNTFTGDEKPLLAKAGLLKDKRVMPFVSGIKKSVETLGGAVLEQTLAFDEMTTLHANLDFLRRDMFALKCESVKLVQKETLVIGQDGMTEDDFKKAETAIPGVPTYRFV